MGSDLTYRIRRSTRARRVRVTVDAAGQVEVVLPGGAGERAAAAAVSELRPWIERRLSELERARATVSARGTTVPYLGVALRLVPEAGRTRVHRRGEALHVPAGSERLAALERWYRRAAYDEVAERLDRACTQVGASYERLTIRGQRTR